MFRGAKGIEVHHLIEKRFLKITKEGTKKSVFYGVKAPQMMSVPMTKALHKTITKRWRDKFAYGCNYKTITKKEMINAINDVYRDMPALRRYALKYLNEVWKQ